MDLISRIGIYFKYATTSLLRRKQRTFFSLLAISLSVASIVAIGIVSYSAESTISSTVKSDLGGDLQMSIRTGGFGLQNTESSKINFEVIETFLNGLRDGGVIEEYTYILNGMGVTDSDEPIIFRIQGIDPEVYPLYGEIETIDPNVGDYNLLLQEENDILISDTLSENLGLGTGNTLLILVGDDTVELNIVGIVSSGSGNLFDYAYIDIESFKKIFEYDVLDNPPNEIYIKTENDLMMEEAEYQIEYELNEKEKYGVRTTTYIEQSESTLNSLSIVFTFFKLSGIVALLVGGLGIITTMYISMKERKQEIGIMKAIGIKNKDVIIFFLCESFLLGAIGSSVGVLIGIIFSKQLAVVSTSIFRTSLIWNYTSDIITYGFLIGIFSTMVFQLLPAYIGSRVRPIIVLKNIEGDSPYYKDLGFFVITTIAILIFGSIIYINLQSWSLVFVIYLLILIMFIFTIFSRFLVKAVSFIPTFGILSVKMGLKNLERNCWTIATALLAISIGLGTVGAVFMAAEGVKSTVSENLSSNLNYDIQIMSIPESKIKQMEERIFLIDGINNIYRSSLSISDCVIEAINGIPIDTYLNKLSDDKREYVEERFLDGVSISGQNIENDPITQTVISGRILGNQDIGRNNVLITTTGASYLNLNVGDKITFTYGDYPFEMTIVGLYTSTTSFGPRGVGASSLGLVTTYDTIERIRRTSSNKEFNIVEINGTKTDLINVSVNIVGNGLENDYFGPYDKSGIIISKYLSNTLNLNVGDTLTLELDNKIKTFKVREIREGPFNLEANLIVPFRAIEDVFSGIYTYTLAIDVKPGYEDVVSSRIESMFPETRTFDTSRIEEMVSNMLDQVIVPISIIASFSLFVAVIVIANMMYISTLDRKREFAIMKAIGAKNINVLKNIIIENISVGLIGGFTALLVLYGASQLMVLYLSLSNSMISLKFIIELIGLSVLISVLASIIPAYNIVKIRPLSVLRYE
ncbi:MAG: macrolide transporter ATP-binding /permease protein [Candidatus Methanofastidiosum methylothiophilum]|uniref:Macrolide transporter ATP-binding /permease protein n=1 Tax=Candidatus Methanofastidiosum methylothiophilum TaxID=1705564 RepID=A0A150J6Y0_9EURY|nr:MAG: macrolide transporter ATP-binding /permease protein [Candidatus Methanofastidiosum methylthiophilus]NMC76712.1 FtsX-like permease family protein [Candidatus Methanofastidiosa archaeon]